MDKFETALRTARLTKAEGGTNIATAPGGLWPPRRNLNKFHPKVHTSALDGPERVEMHPKRIPGTMGLHTGPIHSGVAGRTDHLPMHVPQGSYVVPADIISALGEGNTIAGFKHMRRTFGGVPYGGGAGVYGQGGGPYGEPLASGGRAEDRGEPGVPIAAAGGEYVLSPDEVRYVGRGDLELGHRVLDSWVKRMRAKTVSTLKALPGPAKS